jgi:hypothetical protein
VRSVREGDRREHWLTRKHAQGGGDLYAQVRVLMGELVPLELLEGGHLQMILGRDRMWTLELLAGQDYQGRITGSGASPDDTVADFMVNFERWVATR